MQRQFQQNTNNNLTHHHVAVSASTNSELLHWLHSGRINKARPYMLTASMQTAGRGQHKRTWQSPIGNIYLSLYHPLTVPLSGLLSLVVGYHLTRLPIIQNINRVRQQIGLPSIGVKWANDIGFYDHPLSQGQSQSTPLPTLTDEADAQAEALVFNKLAGILIEPVTTGSRITGVVIGVGINIEAAPLLSETTKEGMDYHAVSLNHIIEDTYAVQAKATHSLTQTAPVGAPRAEDLYLPVSATILRAIQQFITFTDSPYAARKFMSDYDTVSVLAGCAIEVIQHSSQATQDDPQDKATYALNEGTAVDEAALPPASLHKNRVRGYVQGINADGSLKLAQPSMEELQSVIHIYTGTIRVLARPQSRLP